MRFPLAPFAAVLLVLPSLAPAAAGAATVTVTAEEPEGSDGGLGSSLPAAPGRPSEHDPSSLVTWQGDPGTANRLSVTAAAGKGRIVVRDGAAPLRAGAGCRPLRDGAVACRLYGAAPRVVLDGGDGDDELRVEAERLGYLTPSVALSGGDGADTLTVGAGDLVSFDGGAGDDVIVGSRNDDAISGGAGADRIDGGDGSDSIAGDPPEGPYAADVIDGGPAPADPRSNGDTVIYDRAEAVQVDLAAGSGGSPGEGDRLAGIEHANGGAGDDVLLGDGRGNRLSSPGGADRIEGRGGNDQLFGAGILLGGPGKDQLYGNGEGARLDGGPGDDRLSGYGVGGQLDGGPGDDRIVSSRATVAGGDGNDLIAAAGGPVGCGAGTDQAQPDVRATVAPDCEEVALRQAVLTTPRPSAQGRGLRFVVRRPREGTTRCGLWLQLRAADAARDAAPLARRFVPLPGHRRRTAELRAAAPLPALVRLVAQDVSCRAGRPLPPLAARARDGFLWRTAAPDTALSLR